MVASMWLMETPVKLSTIFEVFQHLSKETKTKQIKIPEQMNNWLRYQEGKQAKIKTNWQ